MSSELLSHLDRVYVINLPHRVDRRRQMMEEFTRIGVDPASSKITWFPAVRPTEQGPFPTIGARGCFLSHLGVLQSAKAAGLSRILILEDDVDFNRDFGDRFAAALATIAQESWSMFYGTYRLDQPFESGPGPVAQAPPDLRVWLGQFIMIQGWAIAELAGYLEAMLARPLGHPDGGPMHVDGAYTWFRRAHPTASTYLAVPPMAHERPSRTDIHQLRWFDRWLVLRDLAQLWRRYRWRASLQERRG